MKNAILFHGLTNQEDYYNPDLPSSSNSHWFPWLQKQLLINDIKTDTPEIPHVYEMEWDVWVEEAERFPITEQTILVGHSMGGGFIVRYLSDNPQIKVDTVVLVAPWLNRSHEEDTDFFDFDLRPEIISQANRVIIFASDNDGDEVKDSIAYLQETVTGINVKEFHNYGHFCYRDMHTDAFPELLAACV